jgi:hypothetical protein
LAALSEVPELVNYGLSPTTLLQVLAAKGALYGTLRGVDEVTGSRNPVQEFKNRFRAEKNAQGKLRSHEAVAFLEDFAERLAQQRASLATTGKAAGHRAKWKNRSKKH